MSLFPPELLRRAEQLLRQLSAAHLKLATAESCTGGLLSALLTEIPGSSEVFTHGFVTYANAAKTDMLGLPSPLIAVYGAVSEEVAVAMARDALKASGADVAVAITGIAGPGGATPNKPVGTVHIAVAYKAKPTLHEKQRFVGDRSEVRLQAVAAAVGLVQRSQ